MNVQNLFQIAIDGFHNPSSNNLPTMFKWWPHYIDATMAFKQSLWRCEQWHCKDQPLALCKDTQTKGCERFWKLVNLSA
jgi:hypothetical protein